MSFVNRFSDSKAVGVESTLARVDDGTAPEDYNHVESKYMGTQADQMEMHALGRIQQLRV